MFENPIFVVNFKDVFGIVAGLLFLIFYAIISLLVRRKR